jgi:hypothetical protein
MELYLYTDRIWRWRLLITCSKMCFNVFSILTAHRYSKKRYHIRHTRYTIGWFWQNDRRKRTSQFWKKVHFNQVKICITRSYYAYMFETYKSVIIHSTQKYNKYLLMMGGRYAWNRSKQCIWLVIIHTIQGARSTEHKETSNFTFWKCTVYNIVFTSVRLLQHASFRHLSWQFLTSAEQLEMDD